MVKSDNVSFEEIAVHTGHRARAGVLNLHRHPVRTPVFMPVGTQGTIKGLTSEQLEGLDLDIILANTYHLGLRPGEDVLTAMGGLHSLMRSLCTGWGSSGWVPRVCAPVHTLQPSSSGGP